MIHFSTEPSAKGRPYCIVYMYACVAVCYFTQAGVSKLTEAKNLVDDLKGKAGEQSILLAEKQQEADAALKEITIAMQVS